MDILEKKPLVSVVIPCYNHSDYIQNAINSILIQDYKNVELIVIDDGSKDDSAQKIEEMIRACEDRFIRFEFRCRANRGLCATLNEALAWCQGEYFISIASDDLMLPGRIAAQVKLLSSYGEQCVGVFGSAQLIDQQGVVVGQIRAKSKVYQFKDLYLHRHNLPACTQMIRARALIESGGYPVGYAIEDWYMWLSLTARGGCLVSNPGYYASYRVHASNTSSNVALMHSERLRIIPLFRSHASSHTARLSKACCYLATSMQSQERMAKFCFILRAITISPGVVFERKFYIAMARMVH